MTGNKTKNEQVAETALRKLAGAYMNVLRVEFRSAPTALTCAATKALVQRGWGTTEVVVSQCHISGKRTEYVRVWITAAGKQAARA